MLHRHPTGWRAACQSFTVPGARLRSSPGPALAPRPIATCAISTGSLAPWKPNRVTSATEDDNLVACCLGELREDVGHVIRFGNWEKNWERRSDRCSLLRGRSEVRVSGAKLPFSQWRAVRGSDGSFPYSPKNSCFLVFSYHHIFTIGFKRNLSV